MIDEIKQARVWVKSIKSLLGTDCRTGTIESLNTIERGLDALEKNPEPEKTDPLERFVPEMGESYFIVDDGGSPIECRRLSFEISGFRIATGNFYRTRGQAEKVESIMRRIIELRGDFKVDVNNLGQLFWCVGYNKIDKEWRCYSTEIPLICNIFFPTKEAGKALIKEFGDDLFLLVGRI